MAPTIQNGNPAVDKRQQKPQEKKTDLICRSKYYNTLPDIPFDLKFITYPFEGDRFVQYNPTSLERNYRYEVLTEHDLGVNIDLINVDLYKNSDLNAMLDPADEKLLEEDLHTPQDSRRSKQHARSVSWLRKSEYISTEATRFQPSNMDKIEAKVGYNVKKSLREETLYLDRDSQIKAIQKTFEDTKTPIDAHYSKPGVRAMEVLPVFPDFENWKYPCAQVIFDFDPAPANKRTQDAIEEMSQAMIRGVMDEHGEQFVAYFLPSEDTLGKRRRDLEDQVLYKDDEEYEYKMAREYNWNVKSKASKGYEENYFLVVREDGVYYDELETRVRLSKRRQKVGQAPTNTKLVVKHRPLNGNEHKVQRLRERQLEQIMEEDDDQDNDVEDEHEENETITKTGEPEKKVDETEEEEADDDAEPTRGSKSPSPRRSRSRTRASSAASRSRSRSGSSSAGSGSRKSGSRKSGSRSRSGSRSGGGSRSPSGSRKSGSASRSRSRSASGSEKSGSRSRSGSRSASGSRRSGSASGSARSRSGSPSGSGTPVSRKSVSGSERSGSDSD